MKRLEDKSDLVLTDMAERLVIELTDVLALEEVGSIAARRVPEIYSSDPVNAPGLITRG